MRLKEKTGRGGRGAMHINARNGIVKFAEIAAYFSDARKFKITSIENSAELIH